AQGEPPGPGYGAVPVGQPARSSIVFVDHFGWHRPESIQWNLNVQHQFPFGMMLEVGYMANMIRHLVQPSQEKVIPPSLMGPGNAQLRRPFPQYGSITSTLAPYYKSAYNALRVKLEKRLSNGLSFVSDYSFNKDRTNLF